jgi:hypothetical protein
MGYWQPQANDLGIKFIGVGAKDYSRTLVLIVKHIWCSVILLLDT